MFAAHARERHPEGTMNKRNSFYHGDCLFVLLHDIPAESVDLIYLDPPFFTGKIQKGAKKWQPGAMEISFEDRKEYWSNHFSAMREEAPLWLNDIGNKRPEFAAYLYYMMKRLQACHRVLKKTGSIYLHCDWRASHYLKMIMDETFDAENFQNEIVWCYREAINSKKRWNRKHDIILFYSKSPKFIFNYKDVLDPHSEANISKYKHVDEQGRRYRLMGRGLKDSPISSHRDIPSHWEKTYPELVYRHYLPEGKLPVDYWLIDVINQASKERVGYPTQKPEELLQRIIRASSNKWDIVLDPFCGCGTAIVVAHKLNRRWIGVDINGTAYEITKGREVQMPLGMRDEFAKANYISRDLEEVGSMGAREFEKWVNEFYRATKPHPDRGVDGITKDGIPIQVKTGEVNYGIVSQFLSDAQLHPKVPQPVKQVKIVSQAGFDDSARKRVFEIKAKFGIEVQLKEPKDMLLVSEDPHEPTP